MNRIIILILLLSVSRFSMAQESEKTIYPVVVAFESICCGPPSDSSLINYLNSFKKECKFKVINAYQVGPLGREGEFKIAFPLNGMNKKQKSCFINGIKKIKIDPTDRGQISFYENHEINLSTLPKRTKSVKVNY